MDLSIQEGNDMKHKHFKLVVWAALAGLFAAVTPVVLAADGPGKCGKGKRWDKETQTCVPKPRGSGSGSGSAIEQ